MEVPDWFWQGVVTNLVVDAFGLAVWLAWKNRDALSPQTTHELSGASGGSGSSAATLTTVGSERTASWDVLASVGNERTALWNVETPTPRQMKRLGDELLELGLWYLRLS
jgi:hypothetical protein